MFCLERGEWRLGGNRSGQLLVNFQHQEGVRANGTASTHLTRNQQLPGDGKYYSEEHSIPYMLVLLRFEQNICIALKYTRLREFVQKHAFLIKRRVYMNK